MANNGKGIGPQRLGGSKAIATNSVAKNMNKGYGPMETSSMAKMGAKKGDQSKSRLDYEAVAKMGAKKGDQSKSRLDYETPNKQMSKGMKYDIKKASDQNLSAKARKHYSENAQAASKSGYKG